MGGGGGKDRTLNYPRHSSSIFFQSIFLYLEVSTLRRHLQLLDFFFFSVLAHFISWWKQFLILFEIMMKCYNYLFSFIFKNLLTYTEHLLPLDPEVMCCEVGWSPNRYYSSHLHTGILLYSWDIYNCD